MNYPYPLPWHVETHWGRRRIVDATGHAITPNNFDGVVAAANGLLGTSSAQREIVTKLDAIMRNQEKSAMSDQEILEEARRNTALTAQMLSSVKGLHDENKGLHDQLAAALAAGDSDAAKEALATLKANDDAIDAALNPAPAGGADTLAGGGAA